MKKCVTSALFGPPPITSLGGVPQGLANLISPTLGDPSATFALPKETSGPREFDMKGLR
jgi:hypothetical protein